LITPDGGWGVVCLCGTGTPPTPFFVVLFAMRVRGYAGLCGVVDVGDELLCFVDQGVAEESGTRQQHQHNTSRQYVIEAEPRDR